MVAELLQFRIMNKEDQLDTGDLDFVVGCSGPSKGIEPEVKVVILLTDLHSAIKKPIF